MFLTVLVFKVLEVVSGGVFSKTKISVQFHPCEAVERRDNFPHIVSIIKHITVRRFRLDSNPISTYATSVRARMSVWRYFFLYKSGNLINIQEEPSSDWPVTALVSGHSLN